MTGAGLRRPWPRRSAGPCRTRATTTPTARPWPRLPLAPVARPTTVYLTGTVGLGAGIVERRRVLRGARGLAGEVGHLPSATPTRPAPAAGPGAGRRWSACARCSPRGDRRPGRRGETRRLRHPRRRPSPRRPPGSPVGAALGRGCASLAVTLDPGDGRARRRLRAPRRRAPGGRADDVSAPRSAEHPSSAGRPRLGRLGIASAAHRGRRRALGGRLRPACRRLSV